MAQRAERDPVMDEWRDSLASQLRSILAIQRIQQSDLARAMGMKEVSLSRRLTGKVSFSTEEFLFLSDWMNRNAAEILAAAKTGATNPCLSHSERGAVERWAWAIRGYVLGGLERSAARERATKQYGSHLLHVA